MSQFLPYTNDLLGAAWIELPEADANELFGTEAGGRSNSAVALAEVFDQHEIVVEFIALRVENGTLIRSDG
jgi:hypothetical protein